MCGFVKNHLGRLAPSKRLPFDEDSLKIQVKKKVERLPSFRLIISHCGEGTLLRGGAHREAQAPPLCEYRLTGHVWLSNELLLSHPVYTGERVFFDFG